MSILIFTGLSITFTDAKKILDAEYLPPIKRGDLQELLESRTDIEIIGIIDGVFHQSPAVAHKEILKALELGITVVGGASMGALRACELYPYGMIGVGNIFEDYKNGVIESDDDVAVSLNPETLEQMSESWINMKYNFENATKQDIISEKECDELLHIAKETYYPKRSFTYIIKKSGLENDKKSKLQHFIEDANFDIKKRDAEKVIKFIKELNDENVN